MQIKVVDMPVLSHDCDFYMTSSHSNGRNCLFTGSNCLLDTGAKCPYLVEENKDLEDIVSKPRKGFR